MFPWPNRCVDLSIARHLLTKNYSFVTGDTNKRRKITRASIDQYSLDLMDRDVVLMPFWCLIEIVLNMYTNQSHADDRSRAIGKEGSMVKGWSNRKIRGASNVVQRALQSCRRIFMQISMHVKKRVYFR